WSGGLHRLEGGTKRETLQSLKRETSHNRFQVLHRDHAGALWVGGTASSIYRRRGDRWIQWQPPEAERVANAGGIQAIASQPDGTMWVSVLAVGVYRVVDDRWTLWGGLHDLPREPATVLVVDPGGRLWLGYVDGRAAAGARGRVAVYATCAGLT